MVPGRVRTASVVLAVVVVALLPAGCAAARPAGPVPAAAGSSVAAPPTRAPDVFADGVRVRRTGEPGLWLSWSLQERSTGRRTGSPNAATDRTNAESAIKAWIAADLLRSARAAGRPVTAGERGLIRRAVRASDDDAAESLYRSLGRDAVLTRLQPVCGVDVDTDRRGYWSYAQITAVDATRTLDCVLRLAAGTPGGTELVGDLQAIDDDGRSGIAAMLPGEQVAEKNGWTYHSTTGWNVNCVVAWDDYVLAVLTRFPGGRPLEYGWGVCRDVSRDVLTSLRR